MGYDPINGARGLFAARDINVKEFDDIPIVKVPNSLIVTTYHIKPQFFDIG